MQWPPNCPRLHKAPASSRFTVVFFLYDAAAGVGPPRFFFIKSESKTGAGSKTTLKDHSDSLRHFFIILLF